MQHRTLFLSGSDSALQTFLQKLGIQQNSDNTHHFQVTTHIHLIKSNSHIHIWCNPPQHYYKNNPAALRIYFVDSMRQRDLPNNVMYYDVKRNWDNETSLWHEIMRRLGITVATTEDKKTETLSTHQKVATTLQNLPPLPSLMQEHTQVSGMQEPFPPIKQQTAIQPVKSDKTCSSAMEKNSGAFYKNRETMFKERSILDPNSIIGRISLIKVAATIPKQDEIACPEFGL
ncbi:hypothetical protein [Aquicella lusitana]|uniref:Uncharacterized protein n=1 Tax=Aquicella lusitana TaxID=254246 RepID=A0A370GM98_9COXI|nr:hypothetical protein [Aquicella lusitana]RDI44791.1 hypothetical protein C8D86_10843 [Aquicella lusitana]VVC72988.1 hypothetical protein AQULUS_07140 [Aquicella lusitana]